MSKSLTYKFKIIDNTGGALSITSIQISEYPTPGSGQPVSATFIPKTGYVLGTATINNIAGLPVMIKIEYTTSAGVTSVIYDNVINDPDCVETIVKAGNTYYTRKSVIILSNENGQLVASITMVPPTYF
jgi:hypothetical protein